MNVGGDFYGRAEECGRATVFVFHGVKNKNVLLKTEKLTGALGEPAAVSFLSEKMLFDGVESTERVLTRLRERNVKIRCVPMILQKGYYYDRLCSLTDGEEVIDVFDNEMLKLLVKGSGDFEICMLHESENEEIFEALNRLSGEGVHVCRTPEDVEELNLPKKVTLRALYMLPGGHTEREIFGGEESVYSYLLKRGIDVSCDRRMILDLICESVIQKIYQCDMNLYNLNKRLAAIRET